MSPVTREINDFMLARTEGMSRAETLQVLDEVATVCQHVTSELSGFVRNPPPSIPIGWGFDYSFWTGVVI